MGLFKKIMKNMLGHSYKKYTSSGYFHPPYKRYTSSLPRDHHGHHGHQHYGHHHYKHKHTSHSGIFFSS
jgi:hypothetical protein